MNRGKAIGIYSSKYKGVSFRKKSGKWKVTIKIDGKNKHMGYFEDELHAALEYNAKAFMHYGEFAYLNMIEEPL